MKKLDTTTLSVYFHTDGSVHITSFENALDTLDIKHYYQSQNDIPYIIKDKVSRLMCLLPENHQGRFKPKLSIDGVGRRVSEDTFWIECALDKSDQRLASTESHNGSNA